MNKKIGYKNMSFRVGEMVTCLLNEGDLSRDGASYSVQSELNIDDFVELDIKSRNLYAGYWAPFVRKSSRDENSCMGLVVSEPRWMNLPITPSQTSWAWDELRELNCYRLAVIYMLKPIAVLGNRYMLSETFVNELIQLNRSKTVITKKSESASCAVPTWDWIKKLFGARL